jgi:hypothetical protein
MEPMSPFEYLAVLVSLILGLGITHILTGVGRAIHRRGEIRTDLTHNLWTIATFLILVLNWWVFFQSRSVSDWTFDQFLLVIGWAVAFYLMAVVLYPPGMKPGEDYGRVFQVNRPWFLGLFIASSAIDILQTASRGDLFHPPLYLPFVLHLIALAGIGMVVRRRGYHLFLAGYVLSIGLIWAIGARGALGE